MSSHNKDFAIPRDIWFPKESNFEEDMPLYWGNWGVSSEVEDLKAVLMRRPGKEIESFDHNAVRFRDNVDVELFRKQHDELAQIYTQHGVQVYYVEEQIFSFCLCRSNAWCTTFGIINLDLFCSWTIFKAWLLLVSSSRFSNILRCIHSFQLPMYML